MLQYFIVCPRVESEVYIKEAIVFSDGITPYELLELCISEIVMTDIN